MKELKIITLAGLRSGGKSSCARLIAEKIGTSILNLNAERNAELYNEINTINITENVQVERKEDELKLIYGDSVKRIKTKSNYLICDLGGYFDNRLKDLKSDFYILPTLNDYESIRESHRTAKYILKFNKTANIIFVLNGMLTRPKALKEQFLKDWKEQCEINDLEKYKSFYMSFSNLFPKLVNEHKTKKQIEKEFPILKHHHRYVTKTIDDICEEIGAIK